MNLFLLGGSTILFWMVAEFSRIFFQTEIPTINQLFLIFGATLSLLIYQPHFMTTYFLNYGRGYLYIKENSFILIYFPLMLLLTLSSLVFLNSIQVLGYIYLMVLTSASWHFMNQAIAAMNLIQGDSERLRTLTQKWLKFSMMVTSIYGVLKFLELRGGTVNFFGLNSPLLNISETLLRLIYVLSLSLNIITLYKCIRDKLRVQSYIPWIAFSMWYSNDLILSKYFYLVPIFHSLQYIPFFIHRTRKQSAWRLKVIGVIIFSVLLIQIIPNTLDNFLTHEKEINNIQIIFVSSLLFINLHHFVMETITWRGAFKRL